MVGIQDGKWSRGTERLGTIVRDLVGAINKGERAAIINAINAKPEDIDKGRRDTIIDQGLAVI
ncbi:hypothetical protein MASR1M36_08660 [Candidatus Cloacimonadaceae bacterium]